MAVSACVPGFAVENKLTLEEIIVTSQKRAQSLQDVPAAVNTISGDQLDLTNTGLFSDLSKLTPGLYISDIGDGLGQAVSLRGVGVAPFTTNLRPAVTFFLDGVPLYRIDSAFHNLVDVERVEVLKGPQSTLYGKEVSAGALLITTKRPTLGEFEGWVDVKATNGDDWDVKAAVSIPMGENFAARLVAYRSDSEGELKNIISGKRRSDKNVGGRIKLLFQPTDNLEFMLTHDRHQSEIRDAVRERVTYGQRSQSLITNGTITLPADPFDDKVEAIIASGRDVDVEDSSFTIDWQINDSWDFTSITGYQVFDRELRQGDMIPGTTTVVGGDAAFLPVFLAPFYSEASPGDEKSLSQEFRFSFEGGSWSSMYGVFYNEVESAEATSVAALGGIFPLVTAREKDVSEWSVFTHHTYDYSESWDFVFGARYGETDIEQRNLTSFFTGFFGDGTIPLGPLKTETFENASVTLQAVYALNNDVNLYAGVSQGYKPGGFNDAGGAPSYDPEKSISFEAGMKGEFLDGTLRVNGSVYQQIYDDFQVEEFNPDAPGGFSGILANAAEAHVTGVEVDFTWLASSNVTIDGAVSYIDARYDSYENATCTDEQKLALVGTVAGSQAMGCTSIEDSTTSAPDGFQDLSDKRLFLNSPWTVNLNVQYDAELDSGVAWYIRGEAVFRDDFFGTVALDPQGKQSSYSLYNLRAGMNYGAMGVSLYVDNIFDEDYISAFFPGRDGELGLVGFKGDGRTVGVSARYNF